jgi:hypothetical protein
MTQNVGGIDRILRIVVGLVLDRPGRHRHRRLVGLARRRAAGHRCPWLVPALRHLRFQHLRDEEQALTGT